MSKIIEVIVSPTGQTRVQTKGFAGSECREASKAIELALGGRLSEQLTSEYHESELGQAVTVGQSTDSPNGGRPA